VLSVCGDLLQTGGTADLMLTGGPADTTAFLVLGLANAPTPFAGGRLVPLPILKLVAAGTDSEGSLVLPGIPGGGGPITGYLQAVLVDPAQPAGYGLSNAVQLDFLP
jgi:hypothetical protein